MSSLWHAEVKDEKKKWIKYHIIFFFALCCILIAVICGLSIKLREARLHKNFYSQVNQIQFYVNKNITNVNSFLQKEPSSNTSNSISAMSEFYRNNRFIDELVYLNPQSGDKYLLLPNKEVINDPEISSMLNEGSSVPSVFLSKEKPNELILSKRGTSDQSVGSLLILKLNFDTLIKQSGAKPDAISTQIAEPNGVMETKNITFVNPMYINGKTFEIIYVCNCSTIPFSILDILLILMFGVVGLLTYLMNYLADSVKDRELYASIGFLERSHAQQIQYTIEELKNTQRRLIAQEKLASLGSLTAGIAHEIKNPLNFIVNFSAVSIDLVEKLNLKVERMKSLNEGEKISKTGDIEIDKDLVLLKKSLLKTLEHGERVNRIVQGMIQHSKDDSGDFELVDIHKLIEDAIKVSMNTMKSKKSAFNVVMKKEFDFSISKIQIIPQNIYHVVFNILLNSFQALYEKVQANAQSGSNTSFVPTVFIKTINNGSFVQIVIKDNGIGIPSKDLGKLFNPFFTTKPPGEGTGLGLSISYELIKKHKGNIKAESVPNEYTEFNVILPSSRVL